MDDLADANHGLRAAPEATGVADSQSSSQTSAQPLGVAPADDRPQATAVDRSLDEALASGAYVVQPMGQSVAVYSPYSPLPAAQMTPPAPAQAPSVLVVQAGQPPVPVPMSNPSPVYPAPGSGMVPLNQIFEGAVLFIAGQYYRVDKIVAPKPADGPKGDPAKPPARQAPKFSTRAPKEATAIFQDVWEGREAGRQPRGLIAGCHEALLVVLTHLETRANELKRKGHDYRPARSGGLFGKPAAEKAVASKERIERLVERGLLLKSVGELAGHVKLEPPTEPEARSQVSDGDVDAYISLLWLMLEQGFDHALWSENAKYPPNRTPPPVPPANPAPKPADLPAGAAVLLPVSPGQAKL